MFGCVSHIESIEEHLPERPSPTFGHSGSSCHPHDRRGEGSFGEPAAVGTTPRGREDDDDLSEGSSAPQTDERQGIIKGVTGDSMKALLDSVLHRLLPAAIERMLPAGGDGQQLTAHACQVQRSARRRVSGFLYCDAELLL